MTATKTKVAAIRAGMTGVRIPGHVGTWKVVSMRQAVTPDGEATALAFLEHERFPSAEIIVDAYLKPRAVVCVKIRTSFEEEAESRGYRL